MSTVDPTVARLWFESVDADSSGLLDAKELRQALDIGGLDYTLAQAHLFVRTFDSTGNQKLNVNEFVELHLFLETVQSSFSRVARGGRWLSTADVKQALNLMGHSLSDTAMQAVLSRYDMNRRGNFGVEEFLQMCLFLRTAGRAFQAFDPTKCGFAQFNFNQFCYAASYLA
ncbi:hypothetical protein Vretimale_18943 [Volvox reticuliferus]|uniref:EF-hand domain-containing protein n=1 Tax=Volvox reticuliferus TaxID=1737510 RepID=A0A8J4CTE5_9CHLO|nr:hypothetical protein Vretifemale_17272 [Volvox reticuliferus]GIM16284.1 hypothetical protein Vretimale_18943 [Volvox reticuliferus]